MGYPGSISKTYVISATAAATPSKSGASFTKITVGTGGNILIKGSGIFTYVDIDAASATNVVKYINPDTGVAFPNVVDGSEDDLANGKSAGYYEFVPTIEQEVAVVNGQVLEGGFTSVKLSSSSPASGVVAYEA
jgi:hypothetical protein